MALTPVSHVRSGTLASRPAATSVVAGTMYVATDLGLGMPTFRSDGTVWTEVARVPDVLPPSNLLSLITSSLEGGTGWWAANVNCAVANVVAAAAHGSNVLRLTASSAATMSCITSAASLLPTEPGRTYTAKASAKALVTARNVTVDIYWYDSAFGLISTTSSTPVANTTGGFTEFVHTAQAPANARMARMGMTVVSPANGEQHYFDAMLFAPTPWYLFVPGDTPAAPAENLLTPQDATFEATTGVGGWTGTVTPTRDNAAAADGTWALKSVSAGADYDQLGPKVDVSPGEVMLARLDVVANGAQTTTLYIRWYTSSDVLIDTTDGVSLTNPTAAFTPISLARRAPLTAAKAAIYVVVSAAAAGRVTWIDKACMKRGTSDPSYIAGGTRRSIAPRTPGRIAGHVDITAGADLAFNVGPTAVPGLTLTVTGDGVSALLLEAIVTMYQNPDNATTPTLDIYNSTTSTRIGICVDQPSPWSTLVVRKRVVPPAGSTTYIARVGGDAGATNIIMRTTYPDIQASLTGTWVD